VGAKRHIEKSHRKGGLSGVNPSRKEVQGVQPEPFWKTCTQEKDGRTVSDGRVPGR